MSEGDSDKKPEANQAHTHLASLQHFFSFFLSLMSLMCCIFFLSFFLHPYLCRFSWADCLCGRVWARVEVSELARGSGCHGWHCRDKCRPYLPKLAAPGSHRSSVRLCGHHPYCPCLRWLPKVSGQSHDLKCEKKKNRSGGVKSKKRTARVLSSLLPAFCAVPDHSHNPLLLLCVSTSSELFSSLLSLPSIRPLRLFYPLLWAEWQ